jgi:hypothetical protein
MVLGARLDGLGRLTQSLRQELLDRLASAFEGDCNLTAFLDPTVRRWAGGEVLTKIVAEFESEDFWAFRSALNSEVENLETSDESESVGSFIDRLSAAVRALPGVTANGLEQLQEISSDMQSDLASQRDRLADREGERGDFAYDQWREDQYDRDEHAGAFSDVDE